MEIETIGEALAAGWKLTIRCDLGKRDAMKSIRECTRSLKADLETLVWTRGRDFPIARLESRMKCPACGSRRVVILFDVPTKTDAARVARTAR